MDESRSGPVRSFSDLATPDDRSLRFTPYGLSLAGKLSPESAAAHIQRTLGVGLDSSVPETTRRTLDRVRLVHLYGLSTTSYLRLPKTSQFSLYHAGDALDLLKTTGGQPQGTGRLRATAHVSRDCWHAIAKHGDVEHRQCLRRNDPGTRNSQASGRRSPTLSKFRVERAFEPTPSLNLSPRNSVPFRRSRPI